MVGRAPFFRGRAEPRIVVFAGTGYTPGLARPASVREPDPASGIGAVQPGTDARAPLEAARVARAQELLLTGTPFEVLARIVPEDPLELGARLCLRITERALLVDVERALLCAQALCALHAPLWRGEPALARWLDQRVDEALTAVEAEEALDVACGEAPAPFAASLALDARVFGLACARFNRLSLEQRQAFFQVVLDGVAADRLARARGLSLSELARLARAGLEPFRGAARECELAAAFAPERPT